MIGRSLRAIVNMEALGERQIMIDCDVIQADGGTRTASISGAYVAMYDAVQKLMKKRNLKRNPIYGQLASVSVGIFEGAPVLDLDYPEDSNAETDMNVVMNSGGHFIEVQGTAEGHAFTRNEMNDMLALAEKGIQEIMVSQRTVLGME